MDSQSEQIHRVVMQKTWRKEVSTVAGDTICGGAASGEKMAVSMEMKRNKMMNRMMGEGMG